MLILNGCEFADNVECIIDNDIENATMETSVPKFMIFDKPINVVCDNCGAVVASAEYSIMLNGEEYPISSSDYFMNESTGEFDEYSGQDAAYHNCCMWQENGQETAMHIAIAE